MIAWIVIASLVTAILLSLVLVLVVFGGARENVISAAVLFAFAVGAGLLAVSSARKSDQPQRWALLAAGWLTLAAMVFVVWPGIVATEAIAWMAPVLLLALVVWMARRVRRELHSPFAIGSSTPSLRSSPVPPSPPAMRRCGNRSSDARPG